MTLLPDAVRNVHLLPLLLVALLPVLLHILDRRRARAVAWPAMQFLIPKSRARLRRLRLREALLILVRSLAALLIAYAILQPVSHETRSVRSLAIRNERPTRGWKKVSSVSAVVGASLVSVQ